MVTNREQLEDIKKLITSEQFTTKHTQTRLLIIIADELIKVNHYFESERLRSIMSKEIKL